jgi:ABC-type glycerol-3-phosphate transport system permease component
MSVLNQSAAMLKIKPMKLTRLQSEAWIGLLFLSPWLIGFVLLKALPILAALIFSLTNFKMLTPEATKFVGLENYVRFFGDKEVGASLFGSLSYFLLIATIMIPSNITLVPTYYLYSGHMLNWIGTWLPLIVPHFFGSAILIFLLRQNFKSIPRDLDEAAMLDGAGPIRILVSVILPQSIPIVTTVALLHFFYIWNETRLSSLYLGISPNLQLVSFAVQRNQTYSLHQRR